MKFDFRDNERFVAHWMLEDHDIAKAIAETPKFVNGNKTIAKVSVNDVELSFESLERFMQYQYDRTVEEARKQFSDLDAEVERRLKIRLQNEANSIIERLDEFRDHLKNIDDLITPHWEKQKED